jgi:ferrous iron transport protein A
MNKKIVNLSYLPKNTCAKVVEIQGGQVLRRKLNVLGIREGQTIEIISRQPLMGPITLSVGKCQMTLGRGMAHKIFVEEL